MPQVHKGSGLGLMFCCFHCGILNSFLCLNLCFVNIAKGLNRGHKCIYVCVCCSLQTIVHSDWATPWNSDWPCMELNASHINRRIYLLWLWLSRWRCWSFIITTYTFYKMLGFLESLRKASDSLENISDQWTPSYCTGLNENDQTPVYIGSYI